MSADEDAGLELAYEFDAPLEKVWRALSIADYRDRWLPGGDLVDPGPVAVEEGQAISYRLRDSAPPHDESLVTFRIAANDSGGTRLEIVQRMIARAVANDNCGLVMRAA